MKVRTSTHSSLISLEIEGHVTGIVEVEEIKSIIASYNNITEIEFIFKDAFVIPSSLIGHLVKLAQRDNKRIIIKSSNADLVKLLTDLNLDQMFYIK